MTKSLSLGVLLTCVVLSEASRSTASPADETPLAGSQMIQLMAKADETPPVDATPVDATPVDATPVEMIQQRVQTVWHTTYSDSAKTCSDLDSTNVLTWNANVQTEEECQQACESWGDQQINQNSNRPCGAGFFYHKPDGSPFCRLFEKCETCIGAPFAGTTFTSSTEACTASCVRPDCPRDGGFKPKPDFRGIMCATSLCNTDECCDPLPGWTTTTTTTEGFNFGLREYVNGRMVTCDTFQTTSEYIQCNGHKVDGLYLANGVRCSSPPEGDTQYPSKFDAWSYCAYLTGGDVYTKPSQPTMRVWYKCDHTQTRMVWFKPSQWSTNQDNGYIENLRCYFHGR